MAIKVYPGAKRPSHHISLSDGVRTYGLRLANGPVSMQEVPNTPSTVQFSGGGTKFGDWEPGMSHIEQRTWEGGRANESYVDDQTRYYDAKMAWTLTPGKIFPVPMWKFANGYLTETIENEAGDLDWRLLVGSNSQIAEPITHSSAWDAYNKLYLWVRRIGNPGDLTVGLKSPTTGLPDTTVDSATLSASDVNKNEIYLMEFSLTSGTALTGTTSFVFAAGNSTDDAANHWEIGVDIDGGTGYTYNGSVWAGSAPFSMYYRVSSVVADRKFSLFEFEGALYVVDNKADGTASNLYINGDRGVATSGAATSLADTNKSWTESEWVGAWVKITAGTGIGQSRQITANSSTALTVATWDVNPSTDSEYVIYNTDILQDISPSSGDQIDGVVKSVCIVDDYVCFAQGQSVNILKMRYNTAASPPAHEFDDDGTNKADILYAMFDATNSVQVYAANSSAATIQRAAPAAWLTDMTYGAAKDVGSNEQPIISLYLHDGFLYAFKPDGRYVINPNDTVAKAIGEIGFIKSHNNGEATLFYGLYSYFSWGDFSIQRLYSSSGDYDMTNIGPDRDEGLPENRRGKCVALLGSPPGVIAAIQSEDGYSSVLVLPANGFGWHEIFRGWDIGKKIESIYFQDGYRPRLWISIGGELVYQDWPKNTFNPLKDSGITYYPEASIISSTIDMGASRLPKYIKELSVSAENLSSNVQISLDYQINENVGSDSWTFAGVFRVNSTDSIPINLGRVYSIRYRLRMITNSETTPPIINATVLEGFARTPVKYQWNMRVKISSTQRDMSGISKDVDPDEFMSWIKEAAVTTQRIYMRSIWEDMDSKYVLVEPPTLLRTFMNNILGFWGGEVQITVREG